jgi:hypothetical protein
MLTATPLSNGIKNLHWIWLFLACSKWLTLQLLPDTINNTLNIDDDEVADRTTVSGTERGAGFTLVADLFKQLQHNVTRFGSHNPTTPLF